MASSDEAAALPYEEPSISRVLILSSFLILLNLLNHIFSTLTHCGLIGYILVGIIYGTPFTHWLIPQFEHAIAQLGYLGLILLVYEGGLSTDIPSLRSNLSLSIGVAATGILLPIAFSFVLRPLLGATALQSFAAGAALCSTSLGTTFTILKTSRFDDTRLGVLLSTAAMFDDVVGLVMVKVITALGQKSQINAVTVIRPVCVSIAMVVTIVIGCLFSIRPAAKYFGTEKTKAGVPVLRRLLQSCWFAWSVHTTILLGAVAIASYAGTSNLFAAYLVGAAISWFDPEVETSRIGKHRSKAVNGSSDQTRMTSRNQHNVPSSQDGIDSISNTPDGFQATGAKNAEENILDGLSRGREMANNQKATDKIQGIGIERAEDTIKIDQAETPRLAARNGYTGLKIFNLFYQPAMDSILKAFFFASIGFAIPLTKLFKGPIIWRGIVYTILMIAGKLTTGIWLLRVNRPLLVKLFRSNAPVKRFPNLRGWCCRLPIWRKQSRYKKSTPTPQVKTTFGKIRETKPNDSHPNTMPSSGTPQSQSSSNVDKPLSLYPASILGIAMVARGEIGYLIASLAESNGVFANEVSQSTADGGSDMYLIVIWAITLSTLVAPPCVGMLVKRVKRLQTLQRESGRVLDPLGPWVVI